MLALCVLHLWTNKNSRLLASCVVETSRRARVRYTGETNKLCCRRTEVTFPRSREFPLREEKILPRPSLSSSSSASRKNVRFNLEAPLFASKNILQCGNHPLSRTFPAMYSTVHESTDTRLPARKCECIFPRSGLLTLPYSFCSKDRPVSPVSESTMPQAVSRSPGTPTHVEFAQSPKVSVAISRYVYIIVAVSIPPRRQNTGNIIN